MKILHNVHMLKFTKTVHLEMMETDPEFIQAIDRHNQSVQASMQSLDELLNHANDRRAGFDKLYKEVLERRKKYYETLLNLMDAYHECDQLEARWGKARMAACDLCHRKAETLRLETIAARATPAGRAALSGIMFNPSGCDTKEWRATDQQSAFFSGLGGSASDREEAEKLKFIRSKVINDVCDEVDKCFSI